MKALIQKEIRENIKLAAIALLAGLVLLLLTVQAHMGAVRALALGGGARLDYDLLQPLCSAMFNSGIHLFCALFGLILGWLQLQNEKPRDLWAFLVHRPLTRTEIFLGKAIAGLALYLGVTVVPLLCFVLWLGFLSPQVAPFEWGMVERTVAGVAAGTAYYFAGMLTGIRQARWYASRGLGVLFAIVISAFVQGSPWFWMDLLGALLGAAVLATAVWGAFHSYGSPEPQPGAGRLALVASLSGGAFLATTILSGMVAAMVLYSADRASNYSYWSMSRDGTLYKVGATESTSARDVRDVEGKPLLDPGTGRPVDLDSLNRINAPHVGLVPNREAQTSYWKSYKQRSHFFLAWAVTQDTAWYFVRNSGRLVAFDVRRHQILGSLGPDGFVPGAPPAGPGFRGSTGYNSTTRVRTLNTDNAVYAVDIEKRTATKFFTAAPDDQVLASDDVLLNQYDWDYTVVVTRSFVHLFKPNAELLWKAPYQKAESSGMVQVYFLEPAGRFSLWSDPNDFVNPTGERKLPMQVCWITREQSVTKTIEVPKLGLDKSEYSWELQAANVLSPAVRTMPVASHVKSGVIDWAGVRFALAAAVLVYIPVAWWLGARFARPLGSRLGWAAFILLGGLPAFIAFLSVHEWPAREQCTGCGKLRVVDRDRCEHCGAGFPPPRQIGTEILEPVPA